MSETSKVLFIGGEYDSHRMQITKPLPSVLRMPSKQKHTIVDLKGTRQATMYTAYRLEQLHGGETDGIDLYVQKDISLASALKNLLVRYSVANRR